MAREEEAIAEGPLEEWFRERVTTIEPPLDYEAIHGGLSNLTFLVTDQSGARWVLRRPPLGKALGSAHDMGREVKVVEALAGTDVPVPRVVGYCDDDSVNGAPFYAMDFVEGPVLRTPEQAALFPERDTRFRIGEELIDVLARIHALDPDEIGLGDLGAQDGYVQRQLGRWIGQWEKSKTRELALIEDVYRLLGDSVPPQSETTIVHGDFRLDNVIYSPLGDVAAVVDWELCTLGDPLADLGLLMVYWAEPGDDTVSFFRPAMTEPGFPDRAELAARYAEVSGRDVSGLDFFVALGYWKLAIIIEGVLSRFRKGQYGSQSTEAGDEFSLAVEALAEAAMDAAAKIER